MKTEKYILPSHWASALINGDESGMDDDDCRALNAFVAAGVKEYGLFMCIDVSDDDGGDFRKYHDAEPYGVLACDVATFTFDVTPNPK